MTLVTELLMVITILGVDVIGAELLTRRSMHLYANGDGQRLPPMVELLPETATMDMRQRITTGDANADHAWMLLPGTRT